MVISWYTCLFEIIFLTIIFHIKTKGELIATLQKDWSAIETLAEEHPYIVGLLNYTKDYMCTGTIISKRTVLTSGTCLSTKLKYIVVGTALLRKSIKNNMLLEIATTILHGDYIFESKFSGVNVTRLHSNIGLVISTRPILTFFFVSADIGNYYASELERATLTTVGYGKIHNSDAMVLQAQEYRQIPCTNPKWYYCVCGIEYSPYRKTYEQEFGNGAPVLHETELAAITASPCGILILTSTKVKYNIFTVVGPYLPWIEKMRLNFTIASTKSLRARNSGDINVNINTIYYFYIFIIFIKFLT
ncbi:uncharacterized protein LOC131844474 [Achroia grisella]|uniref:uncharacterized protein LOC131844474 n=1 Tax=Achroia grisella TaxID=688607 RepID=UPI0027D24028|nr:uncharacterized protein LOC131844474 [Achroia grisella]